MFILESVVRGHNNYLQANMVSRVGRETTDRTLEESNSKADRLLIVRLAVLSLAGCLHACRWPKILTETHGRLVNDRQ